jgi:hypothetical protein
MLQISYLSRSRAPMTPAQLLELLLQSRRNNVERGITGMLLYGNGTFLQVIEGEDAVVDRLVERISVDPRHDGIQLLGRREIQERQYTDWSMGFERVTDAGLQQVEGLRDFGARDFNFDYLSRNGEVVETLMDHFRAPHWDPLIRELDAKDKVIDHLSKRLARARGSVEVASLVLESVTEASRQGSLSEEHQRLCQSALTALRQS